MKQLIPAIMRTLIPMIYAVALHYVFALHQFDVPNQWVVDAITVALAVLIYVALRGLEQIEPKLGILLGWIGAPQYAAVLDKALDELTDQAKSNVDSSIATAVTHALNKSSGGANPAAAAAPPAIVPTRAPQVTVSAAEIGVSLNAESTQPEPQVPTGADGRPIADHPQA